MQTLAADPYVRSLIQKWDHDTASFCRFVFPGRFHRPFGRVHDKIFNLIDDESKQCVAIAAPRGVGKSSITQLGYAAKNIVLRQRRYIVPVSASEQLAMQHSENLKNALVTNEWIRKLFPPIQTNENFAQKRWIAFDTMVFPRGRGQQIRGAIFRDSRPDLYLVDDLEDAEHMESEDYREKVRRYFYDDLMNSIDRGSKDWRIVLICTIGHEDCLFENLKDDPEWYCARIPLLGEHGESMWPEFMDTEEIRKLEKSYRDKGRLEWFYREYYNEPVAASEIGFNSKMFQYYDKTEQELNNNPDVETAIIYDPAQTYHEGSAHTAIVGVSYNSATDECFVRDVVHGFLDPPTIMEQVMEMAVRLRAVVIAPEVTGAESFILYPLNQEILHRKLYWVEVVPIKPRDKKQKRAGALIPMYKRGIIYHNRDKCADLERQLLSYPRPRRWDMIDALAHIIPVFYEGDRYYSEGAESPPEHEWEDEVEDMKPLIMDMGV